MHRQCPKLDRSGVISWAAFVPQRLNLEDMYVCWLGGPMRAFKFRVASVSSKLPSPHRSSTSLDSYAAALLFHEYEQRRQKNYSDSACKTYCSNTRVRFPGKSIFRLLIATQLYTTGRALSSLKPMYILRY